MDGTVARLLLLWLLSIVVLPFSTELVAEAGDDPLTKVLYFGSITLAGGCVALVEMSMRRHPELSDAAQPPAVAGAWVNVGLLVLAAALSLAVPALSYYPLLLLLADDLVLGVGRRALGR
jgi:uncharacterized membrane protein